MRNGRTSRRNGRLISALLGATATAAIACALMAPAAGAAALSITSYKITSDLPAGPPPLSAPTVPSDGPSTLQAGAHPSAGSYSSFAYSNPTEDIQTALTNFAPGLLGNPESVPKCPQAALEAGGAACPPGSAIGTSRLDTVFAGSTSPAVSFNGTFYNAELLGNEPGRLASVTPVGGGVFLVSSIPFYVTPRGGGDYGLTGILTDISRLDAVPSLGNLQVSGLSFIINGSTGYVRNPTSCRAQTSTGQANGWDDPTTVEGPPYTFTTTGCDTVAFSPKVAIQLGSSGTTKFLGYPPLVVKITQPSEQADIRNTDILLPVELNSNNAVYKTCTQAQVNADACPANSKFGGVVATSPFLSEPLKGPVYLVQQTSSSLPGLLLDLNGRVHVKIQTSTKLVGGKQIQSLATDAPQLPISELRVALNGGKSTGVFQNRYGLCFPGRSTSKFKTVNADVKLDGWNGKSTGASKVTADIDGCGPAVKDTLKRATGSRPSLKVSATRHPTDANIKELTLTLGSNLRLVKSRFSSGVSGTASAALGNASFTYVDSRTLKVSGLPAAGAAKVTVKLGKGAIRVSNRSRAALRRGKSRRFRVRVRQTLVSGVKASTHSKFKVKGKKRR
jgi:hypothetical protein